MQKRTVIGLVYTILSAAIIISGTVLAVRWANGDFRRDHNSGLMASETGLLNATSTPIGAQVYIDGRLNTATDNVVYLQPGIYQIAIHKDGYSNWQKTLQIERGLVTNTAAKLFPNSPNLSSLTFTGAENLSISPDGQKLLFYTASASAELRNGLYLLDISGTNSSNPKNAKQIVPDDQRYNLANAEIIWSSDSSEFLLQTAEGNYLIPITTVTNLSTQPDITFQIPTLLSTWEEDIYLRERDILSKFPPEIVRIATASAKNVYFSPDKKKLVYTATDSATIAPNLVAALPAASTQIQERQLVPGTIYVYDMHEDRNFKIGLESTIQAIDKNFLLADDVLQKTPRSLVSSPSAFTRLQNNESTKTDQNFATYYSSLYSHTWQWLSDSRHLVGMVNDKVAIVEYDGTNLTTIYSGPFFKNFVYPWADGSRILILTAFSPDSPLNIYGIELLR